MNYEGESDDKKKDLPAAGYRAAALCCLRRNRPD